MKVVVISKENPWSEKLVKNLESQSFQTIWLKEVNRESLNEINPDWIFFFHWSNIVRKEIYEKYKCVVVHTGVLPFHRGGSPLQNQIVNEVQVSNVNLLTMEEQVDSGAIYCKQTITLQGSMRDIWMIIAETATRLIIRCVKNNLTPIEQDNDNQVSIFKRRRRQPICFDSSSKIEDIYNQIRMMDAEGYPESYIEVGDYTLQFTRASLKKGAITADVKISKK